MAYAALHPDCESVTSPEPADIARLAADPKQPGLIVFSLRHTDLTLFEPLASTLQILKISGAPQLTSLDGVERLPGLREFVLATPTGSAGSGRSIGVESFAPLAQVAVPHLQRQAVPRARRAMGSADRPSVRARAGRAMSASWPAPGPCLCAASGGAPSGAP